MLKILRRFHAKIYFKTIEVKGGEKLSEGNMFKAFCVLETYKNILKYYLNVI